MATVGHRVRGQVDDVALSELHDGAFGEPGPVLPWNARLQLTAPLLACGP